MKKLTLFVNDDCVCVSVTTFAKKENIDNIDVHAFGIQETDTLIMPSAVMDPTKLNSH